MIKGKTAISPSSTFNLIVGFSFSVPSFAGEYGAYYRTNDNTRQIYGDAILNIDKYFGDFSLTANLGTSIKDVETSYTYVGGFLNVANNFTLNAVNRANSHMDADPALNYHHQVQSVFATAQVGYKSMVYLDLTARNDWTLSSATPSIATRDSSIPLPV